jgi:hypothetical protein
MRVSLGLCETVECVRADGQPLTRQFWFGRQNQNDLETYFQSQPRFVVPDVCTIIARMNEVAACELQ